MIKTIQTSGLSVNDKGVISLGTKPSGAPLAFVNNCGSRLEEEAHEFPHWPCGSGREYKASFKNFVRAADLPFSGYDLWKFQGNINDKIFALENSPWSKLLAGPCLPVICPRVEDAAADSNLINRYWRMINGDFRRKTSFLAGQEMIYGAQTKVWPLSIKQFTVKLIFPQALPPLSSEEMFFCSREIKTQYAVGLAEPLEIFCAMITYPQIFRGCFRFFFPDFPFQKTIKNIVDELDAENGAENNPVPMLASNHRILSFQIIRDVKPAASDFCPVIF